MSSDLFYAKMLNVQDFILSMCQFVGDLDRLLILRGWSLMKTIRCFQAAGIWQRGPPHADKQELFGLGGVMHSIKCLSYERGLFVTSDRKIKESLHWTWCEEQCNVFYLHLSAWTWTISSCGFMSEIRTGPAVRHRTLGRSAACRPATTCSTHENVPTKSEPEKHGWWSSSCAPVMNLSALHTCEIKNRHSAVCSCRRPL